MSNKYYSGDQTKKNVMAGAFGTLGERKDASSVLMGDLKERDHLEDLAVDWRIILKCVFNK